MKRPAPALGARIQLTKKGGPVVRPRGSRTGEILADCDDCWQIRFDGANTPRRIVKRYVEREAA